MNDYLVAPVKKAATVLRCLASTPEPMTLKGICGVLGLPKTTVFRYLRTLEHSGFVVHDRSRDLYQLDVALLVLIGSNLAIQRLRRAAWPYLESLREQFGETVNLGVMDGSDVVYLEILAAPDAMRTFTRVGGRDPLHATALGKAILSTLSPEMRDAALPERLRKMTCRTLSSRLELDDELVLAAERGYAIERAENEEGAGCIGAAISHPAAGVHAAISLTGECEDLLKERLAEASTALMTATRQVSLACGVGGYAIPIS